jgi:uncharacterized membrane protein SpoIIM required for sporulation
MKQEQFEAHFGAEWVTFELWLDLERLPARERAKRTAPFAASEAPARYREICGQLALARSRDYGPALVDRLHRLAQSGHDRLYGTPGGWLHAWLDFLGGGFARQVRACKKSVFAAMLLFYGPYVLLALAVRIWPDFAYVVLPQELLHQFDRMYGPGVEDALGRARNADTDMEMFGYYIFNNVGIGFRTFAGGVLFGLGAVAALVYNGVFMGVIEAHIINLGYAEHFYSFVAGHSAFELTAITLCGAAGLELGWALLAPGDRPRGLALRETGRGVIGMVAGAAAMLLIAAGIEAFWSPRQLEPLLKYGVGIFNALLVGAYFVFAGRRDAAG